MQTQATSKEFTSFSRQILMPEIGQVGQETLQASHVTVVGCGGLGTPVITYLAAAGVGRVTAVDYDSIATSNLNRQFFYVQDDVGKNKAQALTQKLAQQYAQTHFVAKEEEIIPLENAEHQASLLKSILGTPQCIVLCVDNWQTRLLVNAYAMTEKIPLIDAGVNGFYGYLFATNPQDEKSPCLACMHTAHVKEVQPIPALGATCGVLGSLQASLCLMLLLGMENPYKNMLLQYDGKLGDFEKVPLQINPSCSWHGAL